VDQQTCPFCERPLAPSEVASRWCESCGASIPDLAPQAARPGRGTDRLPEATSATPSAGILGVIQVVTIGVGGVAILAANAVVAWALAGMWVWLVVMALVAIVPLAQVLGIVKNLFAGRWDDARGSLSGWTLVFLLYSVAFVGGGFLVSNWFASGDVHVDNASPHQVVLELDGKQWLRCDRGGNYRRYLARGTYTLVVRSTDGEELDRHPITVEGREPYILNVLGAQVYSRGTVQYGGVVFGSPRAEERAQLRWFKPEVDYLFKTPPKSLSVSSKSGESVLGAIRTYLRRGEPIDKPPTAP
jgi:hypothetical protein